MKNADYYLLDVFTNQPFTGNPLAVFLDTDGLTTHTMQTLANELNLAETVFLSTANGPHHYPMRIFTPTRELPFAGHPTVGAAHLLAELNVVNREQGVVLHPPTGELAVNYEQGRATFTTAQPANITPSTIDHITAAALLGLDINQVKGNPVISSCGLPYHLIEVTDIAALEQVHIATNAWANAVASSHAEQVYLYVIDQKNGAETVVKTRMFCMHASLCEDPATGSAAAALTGFLASLQPTPLRLNIHQGTEMGRPSVIYTAANGEIKPGFVAVGGNAKVVGKGTLYLAR